MKKTLFALALCLSAMSDRAVAGGYPELPFDPNPKAFADFINRFAWDDGKKRIFSNLRKCYEYNDDTPYFAAEYTNNYYLCRYGYMTITDIMHGTRFCELSDSSKIIPGKMSFDKDTMAAVYIRVYSAGDYRVMHAPAKYCRFN